MLEKPGDYKPKFIFSTGDVCEILGVSRQTLSDWKKDDCPFLGRGKWDLAAVVQWDRGRFANRQVTPEETGIKLRKLQADTLFREERAKREKIMREALEDLYFRKEDVEDAWAMRALEAKSTFMLFAKVLPMELAGKTEQEMEAIIAERVREVLSDYARGEKYTPDPNTAAKRNHGVDAAGKTPRKPVGRPQSHPGRKDKRDAGKVEN